jgi:hypothetical protein
VALLRGKPIPSGGMLDDVAAWQHGMPRSLISDPRWHFAWLADLARASGCFMWTPRNPRLQGPDLVQRTRFPDTSRHARDILGRGAGAR